MTATIRPPVPPSTPGASADAELVTAACRAIDAATDGAPRLADLARHLDTTPDRLRRAFRAVLGVTPHQYADSVRLARFQAEVRDGAPVTTAMYAAGYSSSSRLYEGAPARLGMTPASYGAGGAGVTVRFGVVRSVLGWVCVAVTDVGVCHIGIAPTAPDAAATLRRALPAATLDEDPGALQVALDEVLTRIEGRPPAREVPLDVRGTAFQRRVWEELQRIPRGETRTYAQVAAAIGAPRAARAVGQACATNPVAVLVPCHRVVRSDGDLSGYAWGVDVKRALLTNET